MAVAVGTSVAMFILVCLVLHHDYVLVPVNRRKSRTIFPIMPGIYLTLLSFSCNDHPGAFIGTCKQGKTHMHSLVVYLY